MRQWLVGLGLVLAFSGCAWLTQARKDYTVGKTTPLSIGEVSPHERAVAITQPFEQLPYGQFARFGVPLLAVFLTWLRGRRIRKGQSVSTTPVTGMLGAKTGLETVIQFITTLSHGAFEWGGNGSPLKRGIKVGVSFLLAALAAAASSPDVAHFVASHAVVLTALTATASVIAAIEKSLSQVLPVQPLQEPHG